MGWLFQGLGTRPLSTTFDTHSHEASAITTHSGAHGLRCELSKVLAPFLQITAIRTAAQPATQLFTTLSLPATRLFGSVPLPGTVFQLCFDTGRSYQLRAAAGRGPLVARVHSIVSAQKAVYTQLEALYTGTLWSIGARLVSPTFAAADLVYVFSCWRALGAVCLGAEVVGVNNEVGISVASRVEAGESVCCLSLQRLNTLTASFYRRLRRGVEVGAEVSRSAAHVSAAGGLRLRTFRTELKCNIDQRMRVGFEWDEKLTESLSVNFNGTYDTDGLGYGLSMLYDG